MIFVLFVGLEPYFAIIIMLYIFDLRLKPEIVNFFEKKSKKCVDR